MRPLNIAFPWIRVYTRDGRPVSRPFVRHAAARPAAIDRPVSAGCNVKSYRRRPHGAVQADSPGLGRPEADRNHPRRINHPVISAAISHKQEIIWPDSSLKGKSIFRLLGNFAAICREHRYKGHLHEVLSFLYSIICNEIINIFLCIICKSLNLYYIAFKANYIHVYYYIYILFIFCIAAYICISLHIYVYIPVILGMWLIYIFITY